MTLQEGLWLAVGGTAQLLFAGRMAIQWWTSERRGESVVPACFWYLSLAGGVLMLAYALFRRDPVFICGQAAGLFVYARNVALLPRAAAPGAGSADSPRFSEAESTGAAAARV